jgi:hypothetical protein
MKRRQNTPPLRFRSDSSRHIRFSWLWQNRRRVLFPSACGKHRWQHIRPEQLCCRPRGNRNRRAPDDGAEQHQREQCGDRDKLAHVSRLGRSEVSMIGDMLDIRCCLGHAVRDIGIGLSGTRSRTLARSTARGSRPRSNRSRKREPCRQS